MARCPLLAQSRHELVHSTCPLLGVERDRRCGGRGLSKKVTGVHRERPVSYLSLNGHNFGFGPWGFFRFALPLDSVAVAFRAMSFPS
jgi:hypothetical protein